MSQPYQPAPKSGSGAAVGISIVVIVLVAIGVAVVICVVAAGILLLPAVMQVRQAARAVQTEDRFRQVGLAFLDYHDQHRQLPPAVISADDGTQLRSWRAELLPYLERSDIHDRLDLSKPWDDPANAFVRGTAVVQYQSPLSENEAEFTNMVAVVGQGSLFDPNARQPLTLEGIRDGMSNTILLIEWRNSDIPWYEPRDVTIAEAVAMIQGQSGREGTTVLFADGSTKKISPNINESVLRAMFTFRAGD